MNDQPGRRLSGRVRKLLIGATAATLLLGGCSALGSPGSSQAAESPSVEWQSEKDTDVSAQVTGEIDYAGARYLIIEDGSTSHLKSAEAAFEPNKARLIASYGDTLTVWAVSPESERTEIVGKWTVTRDGLVRGEQ